MDDRHAGILILSARWYDAVCPVHAEPEEYQLGTPEQHEKRSQCQANVQQHHVSIPPAQINEGIFHRHILPYTPLYYHISCPTVKRPHRFPKMQDKSFLLIIRRFSI